jgi:probable rRNA maturation factor
MAPSTMILLAPDLDPESPHGRRPAGGGSGAPPSPETAKAKRPAASNDVRLPSARTLALFLSKAQAAVRLKGEVSVLLTTDAAIQRLNRQFRGKNKATDVLSFPADGIGAEEIAGDLAISVPTALRQAVEQGHPLSTEIKVLMLHGLLHLAGYDHETDAGQMARRERLLRARLALPQGLIERAAKSSKTPFLKGHGLSDAAKSAKKAQASVREGMRNAGSGSAQGLKPTVYPVASTARLKSCPDTSCTPKEVFPQPVKSKKSVVDEAARPKPRPVKAAAKAARP